MKIFGCIMLAIALGMAAIGLTVCTVEKSHLQDKPASLKSDLKAESLGGPVQVMITNPYPESRQQLVLESPSLQMVLAIDPNVGIHRYFRGPTSRQWQVIGDINVLCSEGGYGPTLEDAARDCLAQPRVTEETY